MPFTEINAAGRAAAPPSFLLAVPNVTAHPSTANVPITVLLYDGPLLCGFNVAINGLSCVHIYGSSTLERNINTTSFRVDEIHSVGTINNVETSYFTQL